MRALVFLLKLLLKIVMVPVILALTLFVWICVGIVYVSGLVLGLISMVIALLGVAVLLTCSLQNGIILLVIGAAGGVLSFLLPQVHKFFLPLLAVSVVAAVAGIAYAVYRFFTPDYLEDFEEDFDDDFEDEDIEK